MSLTIAGITFEDSEYDDRGDVLYLSVGPPREPARTVATPEGHAIDYDQSGAVIGMVLGGNGRNPALGRRQRRGRRICDFQPRRPWGDGPAATLKPTGDIQRATELARVSSGEFVGRYRSWIEGHLG